MRSDAYPMDKKRMKGILASKLVVAPTGCWIWQGQRTTIGSKSYGRPKIQGNNYSASAVSWWAYGEDETIQRGKRKGVKHFRQSCENSLCINPEHLYMDTHRSSPPFDFWAKVDKSAGKNECWLWTGKRKAGEWDYGIHVVRGHNIRAHRTAWILTHGDPGELFVLHRCDTPACVNPSHLFLGDHDANMEDASNKKRFAACRVTHCPAGHPYSGDNLILECGRRGRKRRACRECKRRISREWARARRQRDQR